MHVAAIRSVREGFQADLRKFPPGGTCLLPEWVCEVMVAAAVCAGFKVCFYRCLPPSVASAPLSADFDDLDDKLGRLSDPVVLLAHPLGYVDPGVASWLRSGSLAPERIFLDLSQSYGAYDFREQIELSSAGYISFNGKKLLGSGGALRMVPADCANSDYSGWAVLFGEMARQQFESADRGLCAMRALLNQLAVGSEVVEPFFGAVRSSAHRTVVQLNAVALPHVDQLSQSGLGQTFYDPSSVRGLSANYMEYISRYYSVFHSRRCTDGTGSGPGALGG